MPCWLPCLAAALMSCAAQGSGVCRRFRKRKHRRYCGRRVGQRGGQAPLMPSSIPLDGASRRPHLDQLLLLPLQRHDLPAAQHPHQQPSAAARSRWSRSGGPRRAAAAAGQRVPLDVPRIAVDLALAAARHLPWRGFLLEQPVAGAAGGGRAEELGERRCARPPLPAAGAAAPPRAAVPAARGCCPLGMPSSTRIRPFTCPAPTWCCQLLLWSCGRLPGLLGAHASCRRHQDDRRSLGCTESLLRLASPASSRQPAGRFPCFCRAHLLPTVHQTPYTAHQDPPHVASNAGRRLAAQGPGCWPAAGASCPYNRWQSRNWAAPPPGRRRRCRRCRPLERAEPRGSQPGTSPRQLRPPPSRWAAARRSHSSRSTSGAAPSVLNCL